MQRKVDLLGYIVICGIVAWCFAAMLLPGKLYLICSMLVFFISILRAKLYHKIPESERKTYNLFWSTGRLLHPYAQLGITLFLLVVSLFAEGKKIIG